MVALGQLLSRLASSKLRSKELLSIGILLFLILLIIVLANKPQAPKTATKVFENKPTVTLFCFNFSSTQLIQTTVETGCPLGAQSLGSEPIATPTTQASEINPTLLTRFNAAQATAKLENIPLAITSGFRSQDLQAALFAKEVKLKGSEEEAMKWVLPPKYSHHPMGLAIDVNYDYDKKSTKWLEIYGYKFGLCRVYENEWWHFEGMTVPGTPCPALKVNALTDANPIALSSPAIN